MASASHHSPQSIDTMLIHKGNERVKGAAVFPIFQSVTFGGSGMATFDNKELIDYSRPSGTPNHKVLATKMAAIEGTEAAIVTASGMAAISSTLMALLRPGDHLMIQAATYGGTLELVHYELAALGVSYTTVDQADSSNWQEALRPNTKVFYVEAISNPLMQLADVEAVAAFSKEHGLTPVIDNTFATPVLLRPAELGFIVIHSATKYLNGHSDILAGTVAGPAAFIEKVREKIVIFGGVLDPHACFLLQRGLTTLGLRFRQQAASAMALAQYLEQHPQIERVAYPGLPSSRYHALAQKLLGESGGSMLAFEVRGGKGAALAFMQALTLPLIAPSLGGVESLVTMPAETSHLALGVEGRKAAGISESLIRLSVGIEGTQDLIADLAQALAAVAGSGAVANGHAVSGLKLS